MYAPSRTLHRKIAELVFRDAGKTRNGMLTVKIDLAISIHIRLAHHLLHLRVRELLACMQSHLERNISHKE